MVEKAGNPVRRIGGNELMSRARRQAPFKQVSRGDRPTGDEDFKFGARMQQPFDQPKNCR